MADEAAQVVEVAVEAGEVPAAWERPAAVTAQMASTEGAVSMGRKGKADSSPSLMIPKRDRSLAPSTFQAKTVRRPSTKKPPSALYGSGDTQSHS